MGATVVAGAFVVVVVAGAAVVVVVPVESSATTSKLAVAVVLRPVADVSTATIRCRPTLSDEASNMFALPSAAVPSKSNGALASTEWRLPSRRNATERPCVDRVTKIATSPEICASLSRTAAKPSARSLTTSLNEASVTAACVIAVVVAETTTTATTIAANTRFRGIARPSLG